MEVVPEKKKGFQSNNLEEAVSKDPLCWSVDFLPYCSRLCEKESEENLRVLNSNQVIEASDGSGSGSKACRNHSDSKAGFHLGMVEKLHMRLQILEEDNENIKKEFFGSVEERHGLLNEVSQQFHIIYQHLRSRSRIARQKSLLGWSLFPSPNEDASLGTGLSQILQHDSNPSLVSRLLRAKMFTFQDPSGAIYEYSSR